MKKIFLILIFTLSLAFLTLAQEQNQTPATMEELKLELEQDSLTKKEVRKAKKSWKIENGKPMFLPLIGPAYTPEMGFTIAGGTMISFKTNPKDSLIQRSSSPVMLGLTSTGGYFASSIVTTYWLQDKLRINGDFWIKNMPDHYFGVGYDDAFNTPKSDSTTLYQRSWWWINPRFLWQFMPDWFVGFLIDANSTNATNPSQGVQEDAYYQAYGPKNMNIGWGLIARYDSRDVPVNAYSGMYVDFRASFYSEVLGSDNTYQTYLLDLRKYFTIKRPGQTLALQVKTRIGQGSIPYAEMSQIGTPFDLRGYLWGQYRHESILIFLGEYRHMFKKKDGTRSKHGMVGWVGTGSLGYDFSKFHNWLPNGGIGYRLEVQPRMNVRVDIGFGRGTSGFYFNFNEAF